MVTIRTYGKETGSQSIRDFYHTCKNSYMFRLLRSGDRAS